jgi:hypothetical protein
VQSFAGKYGLQKMKFLTSVGIKLFCGLYSKERTGYVNGHNYSRVKLIEMHSQSLSSARGGRSE